MEVDIDGKKQLLHLPFATPEIMVRGNALRRIEDEALARYALDGLHNKMLVREYLTALPPESELAQEVNRAREVLVRQVEARRMARRKSC